MSYDCHDGYTGSHLITDVKHDLERSILGWVTTTKNPVYAWVVNTAVVPECTSLLLLCSFGQDIIICYYGGASVRRRGRKGRNVPSF